MDELRKDELEYTVRYVTWAVPKEFGRTSKKSFSQALVDCTKHQVSRLSSERKVFKEKRLAHQLRTKEVSIN